MAKLTDTVILLLIFLLAAGCAEKADPVTAGTALDRYLDNGDDTYEWKVVETEQMEKYIPKAQECLWPTKRRFF